MSLRRSLARSVSSDAESHQHCIKRSHDDPKHAFLEKQISLIGPHQSLQSPGLHKSSEQARPKRAQGPLNFLEKES